MNLQDLSQDEFNKEMARLEKMYPQGWSYYPGDTCQHGVYVGGCGVDWMCIQCELE